MNCCRYIYIIHIWQLLKCSVFAPLIHFLYIWMEWMCAAYKWKNKACTIYAHVCPCYTLLAESFVSLCLPVNVISGQQQFHAAYYHLVVESRHFFCYVYRRSVCMVYTMLFRCICERFSSKLSTITTRCSF